MKTNNLFIGTALLLALSASGASFAATTTAVPAQPDAAAIRAQHQAETAGMTQAQREAYRAQKQAEMTPEQRAAMRAEAGKGGKGNQARDGSGAGRMQGGMGAHGGMGQGKGR